MFAVVSDIHANLEAFQAVLDDIDAQGIERILCLGDLVGYGPDPVACVSLARRRCDVTLRGNHDLAVLQQPLGFNRAAREAVEWTRSQLKPRWRSGLEARANWRFLSRAPKRFEEGRFLFVHGSPRDPVTEYVEKKDTLDLGFGIGEKLQVILDLVKGLCFLGHTHAPGVIDGEGGWHAPADLPDGWPIGAMPAILNVGSVGQPRDGDPRACWVAVDAERARFRRAAYDVETTARKVERHTRLQTRIADRLRAGR